MKRYLYAGAVFVVCTVTVCSEHTERKGKVESKQQEEEIEEIDKKRHIDNAVVSGGSYCSAVHACPSGKWNKMCLGVLPSPNASRVAVYGLRHIFIYDTTTGKQKTIIPVGDSFTAFRAQWSNDSSRITVLTDTHDHDDGEDYSTFTVWNATSGLCFGKIDLPLSYKKSVFTGAMLAAAGNGGQLIKLINVTTGEDRWVKHGRDTINAMVMNSDNTKLATGDWRGGLNILDIASGTWRPLSTKEPGNVNNYVKSLAFSPIDTAVIAVCLASGTLNIWNTKDKPLTLLQKLKTSVPAGELNVCFVENMLFSPDGSHLATIEDYICGNRLAEPYGRIKVYEIATGLCKTSVTSCINPGMTWNSDARGFRIFKNCGYEEWTLE